MAVNAGGDLFSGTWGNGVFRSTDDGSTWVSVSTGLTNNDVHALAINVGGDVFAGTGSGVFRSTDDGGTWLSISTGLTNADVRALAVNAGGDVFAGGIGGVFRSMPTDGTAVEDEHRTEATPRPAVFRLARSYPNPFNPETTITCGLREVAHIRLSIYSLSGHDIRRLVDTYHHSPGHYAVV